MRSFTDRIHTDRAPGGDRDHRGVDCTLAAGRAGRARGGASHAMHQQHEADWPGAAPVSLDLRRLPPAGSVDMLGNSGGSGRVPQTASIHLRLTNYLEQRAVYDAYNFALGDVLNGSSVPANTTVMSTAIPGYLCPSDPNPGSTEDLAVGFSVRGHHGELRGQRRRESPEHRR